MRSRNARLSAAAAASSSSKAVPTSGYRDLPGGVGSAAVTAAAASPVLGSSAALPSPPDLSYLTQEERAIISGVMHRQKDEETREIMFLR